MNGLGQQLQITLPYFGYLLHHGFLVQEKCVCCPLVLQQEQSGPYVMASLYFSPDVVVLGHESNKIAPLFYKQKLYKYLDDLSAE